MSAINTGGPAFPGASLQMESMTYTNHEGMTLRDYFAAKALQGMLADLPNSLYGLDWMEKTAKSAYSVADAMLAAREKGGAA